MARSTRMIMLVALLACAWLAAPAQGTHVQCGDTITADTTLDSDLRNCPGDGLVIAGDDVTVNFAGHKVDGTGTANGVRTEGNSDRFTLVGGTIRQFRDGVFTDEVRALLRQMRVLDNVEYGVEAYGAGADVRDSLVAGNEIGTWQANTSGSTFRRNSDVAILYSEGVGVHTDNVVRRNGAGIAVAEGDGAVVGNAVTDNLRTGISWEFSGRGPIRDNVVARNGVGIEVRSNAEPLVEGNRVFHNRLDGVFARWSDGSGSLIRGNSIQGNGGNGIFVTGRDPCPSLRDNDLVGNGAAGLLLTDLGSEGRDCDQTSVIGNFAARNAGDGLHVTDNASDVLVEANRTDRNGDDGIDVGPRGAGGVMPTWSPSGSHIAFVAEDGVHIAAPDATAFLRLADGEYPDWSPDGQRIAFTRQSIDPGVFTINRDGSGRVEVAPSDNQPSAPAWSPDGQTILYGENGTIYTVPAGGGIPQAITSGTPANDAEWSPDGSRVLFESSPNIVGDGNIYLTAPAGGPATLLTAGHSATWSPDGTQVVFVRDGNLYVIGTEGAGLRPLTSGSSHDSQPSWSPDGNSIAFLRFDPGHDGLYVIAPDGSALRRIVASGPDNFGARTAPSWSPDSSRITSEIAGWVWVVNRDGSGLLRLALPENPRVTLTANSADRNRDLGMEAAPGVVDGGGNRARHNGDPRQCVGVPCR